MNLTLSVDASSVIAGLQQASAALADEMGMLNAAGEAVTGYVKQRIRSTKTDPSMAMWAPWMPSTAKARERKGNTSQGLLWDSGNLLDSIHHEILGNSVLIGSEVSYATYLQMGTDTMAAREFLGWDSQCEAAAVAAVEKHLLVGMPK